RYPFISEEEIWNPLEEYEEKDAKEALKKAKEILKIVKKFL
ncbi:MAG: HEPN domain-containing protein, partial [Thermoplasmata archaeon]